MAVTSFHEVNEALAHYIPRVGAIHEAYTLERIKKLMDYLGNPQERLKIVHVAGTSGKTSTCYYIAALLGQTGAKVGLTVSPHIEEVNERLQINLRPLAGKAYFKYFNQFMKLIETSGIKPTYFELLIAFAYWVFDKEGVDYAVVEVGLGGLLDGTNVIKRADKVCIITDIDLDHTEVLGQTVEEIAAQKAGIIRAHNTVFAYDQGDAIMQVIREVCEQEQAELHEVWPLGANELPRNLPLFQRRNWYLALSVYGFLARRDRLPQLNEVQLKASTEIYIPGRMEIIVHGGKTIILDGAHNAQKMEVLARSLKHAFPGQQVAVMLALKQGKNFKLRNHLESLLSLASYVIVTAFEGSQDMLHASIPPIKIAEYLDELGYEKWELIDDTAKAFAQLMKRPEPVLLVTGSFYLLDAVRPLLRKAMAK